jgi:hypothetical protein
MLGNPSIRELEYTALTSRTRDIARGSSQSWTTTTIASATLLAWAILTQNPGLLLPAVLCAACGYYVTLHARRETMLLEGYLQETYESEGSSQWHTKHAQVQSLPGSDHGIGNAVPLALAQLVALLSVVLAWVFVKSAPHGELLAGLTTACGVAFGLHSVTEHLRYGQVTSTAYWAHVSGGPREVRPNVKRVAA